MLTVTTRSRSTLAHDRLDAHYFTATGVAAAEQLALLEAAGTKVVPLGDLADVWDPSRFARVYAAPQEEGVPYLRPYDVFDYLPEASDRLAVGRNKGLDKLIIREGDILQTCSGRNLGPLTIADETLAGVALSHDMIRISAADDEMRMYVLAYLKTVVGQALLRRGRSGSVIDHITVADVAGVPIALPPRGLLEKVHGHGKAAVDALAGARSTLRRVLAKYQTPDAQRDSSGGLTWSMSAKEFVDRLDAAYHAPRVQEARTRTRSGGVRLGDLATAHLPARYKRYYVGADHGRPIVSGRQLLQHEPVNLRYVSDRSFRDPAAYELSEGMTVFGAVGRAEGKQGAPALVTIERAAWLASNDVMRLVPKNGTSPAALWLAVASTDARAQINALSFGSVVDHMNPWDVENVWLPEVSPEDAEATTDAWDSFTVAATEIRAAVSLVEGFLAARGA